MHHNTSDTSNCQIQDLSNDILINNANNSAFNTEICNLNNTGKVLIYENVTLKLKFVHFLNVTL